MVRWIGWFGWIGRAAVLGAAALAASCNAATFACTDDSQCALAGEPGVCQADGNCSYPDGTCPSGYRYPAANGGQCVAGETSGVADEGTATGGGSASATDTGATQTSSADSTVGGSNPDDDADDRDDDDLETSADDAPTIPCNDVNEAKDEIELEAVGCSEAPVGRTASGVLDGSGDIDEYKIEYDNDCAEELSHGVVVNSDTPMRACVYFQCAAVGLAVGCGAADVESMWDDLPGCCSPIQQHPQPQVQVTCSAELEVNIVLDAGVEACTPYLLSYGTAVPPD